jgi:hypothetical protein
MVKGCVVYNEDGPGLGPAAAMMEKLLEIVYKQLVICAPLIHSRKQDALLGVCWQYLVSVLTVELSDLHRRNTSRRLSRLSAADSLIAS